MASALFVMTGGPAVGKTTLTTALARLGYTTVRETARDIIAAEQALGSTVLPWRDKTAFQLAVLGTQLQREREARGAIVFCDRGIPDGIAYLRLDDSPIPIQIADTASDRYAAAFFLEPVGEVEADGVRYEDPETAARVHQLLHDVYVELGYEVIRVPALSVAARVEFVCRHVSKKL